MSWLEVALIGVILVAAIIVIFALSYWHSKVMQYKLNKRRLEVQSGTEFKKETQDRQKALLARLAHNLETPFSQIEAAVVLIQEELDDTYKAQTPTAQIYEILEICESFLLALNKIVKASQAYNPGPINLHEEVAAAASRYANQAQPDVQINTKLPEYFNGYSNNYILAMLLPLLKNAYRSAREDSSINVTAREEVNVTTGEEWHEIDVSFDTCSAPQIDSAYVAEPSTQPSDQSPSLSVAKCMLSLCPKATLTLPHIDNDHDDKICFRITLRKRQGACIAEL